MGARLLAALLIGVLPAAVGAQDGLRSASLPERTPTNAIPPEPRDLFRAGPDTYRPRPIATPGPYVVGVYAPSAQRDKGRHSHHHASTADTSGSSLDALRPGTPAADAPVTPAVPAPVAQATPRTFYVIPGCYAGDRRPDPSRLRRGCSLSRLRTIAPIVNRVVARRRG